MSLFVRHVLAYPLAGCALAVAAFIVLLRPYLSWDPWAADIAAVACGTLGILTGGAFAFRPRSAAQPAWRATVRGRRLAPAFGAVLAVVLLAGWPSTPVAAVVSACLAGAAWLAISSSRRPPLVR